AAATTAVAVALGAVYLSRAHDVDCGGGDRKWAAVWNAERAGAMQHAFAASGRAYAGATFVTASHLLDGWGSKWQNGYRAACEATRVTGDQSEHVLDVRMRCLTRRLQEAGATVDVLV